MSRANEPTCRSINFWEGNAVLQQIVTTTPAAVTFRNWKTTLGRGWSWVTGTFASSLVFQALQPMVPGRRRIGAQSKRPIQDPQTHRTFGNQLRIAVCCPSYLNTVV